MQVLLLFDSLKLLPFPFVTMLKRDRIALSVSLEVSSAQDSAFKTQHWFPHSPVIPVLFSLRLLTDILSFLNTSVVAMFCIYISFLFIL